MLFSGFDLIEFLYYFIPAASLIFFAVSLIRYLTAKRKNKRAPGSFSDAQISARRICLIVSSIIAGAMLIVVVAFFALMLMAVAFM